MHLNIAYQPHIADKSDAERASMAVEHNGEHPLSAYRWALSDDRASRTSANRRVSLRFLMTEMLSLEERHHLLSTE